MTDDEALIEKAAEALLPYLSAESHYVPDWPEDESEYYRNGDWSSFPERRERLAAMRAAKAARAVIAAVRDQIVAEALREAARAESINFVVTTAQLIARADRLTKNINPKELP